jgi:hypothetical protein
MRPVVLFRSKLADESEVQDAKKYFPVCDSRCAVPKDSLVIGRYSVLPYYQELESDLKILGSELINSYQQHRWIADFDYYEDLKDYTPESWNDTNFYQCTHPGPFVVKGKTNSRKHQWNSQMYAETKREACDIAGNLMADLMIGSQGIVYRKFVPLRVFEYGINGLPFSNEWRIFYYKTNRLSHGYYWSVAENFPPEIDPEALKFADEVAQIASEHVNFFVLDVAEKADGGWILIEVNDACMSGLSENKGETLYSNLAKFV